MGLDRLGITCLQAGFSTCEIPDRVSVRCNKVIFKHSFMKIPSKITKVSSSSE